MRTRLVSALTVAIVAAGLMSAATAGSPRIGPVSVQQVTAAGPTPHFPAFDPSSGRVLVSNVQAGTVSEVVPGGGVLRSFPVGSMPHTVVVDDGARRAYVTNKGAASVSVLDLVTGETLLTFPVGPNPHGLALDVGRGRLYVTSIDANAVEAYDLTAYGLVGSASVGQGPWGVDARGDRIAVADTGGTTVQLLNADTFEPIEVVDVGDGPWNVKLGESGTFYATLERSGEVVAVRDGLVLWRTDVGTSPHGIVVDESRRVVYAAVTGADQVAVIESDTGRLVHSVDVPKGPAGMTYDPSSGTAYTASQGAGLVVSLAPWTGKSGGK